MKRFEVEWIEKEKAGATVRAKNKKEALEFVQKLGEDHPNTEEWWERTAIGASNYKVKEL